MSPFSWKAPTSAQNYSPVQKRQISRSQTAEARLLIGTKKAITSEITNIFEFQHLHFGILGPDFLSSWYNLERFAGSKSQGVGRWVPIAYATNLFPFFWNSCSPVVHSPNFSFYSKKLPPQTLPDPPSPAYACECYVNIGNTLPPFINIQWYLSFRIAHDAGRSLSENIGDYLLNSGRLQIPSPWSRDQRWEVTSYDDRRIAPLRRSARERGAFVIGRVATRDRARHALIGRKKCPSPIRLVVRIRYTIYKASCDTDERQYKNAKLDFCRISFSIFRLNFFTNIRMIRE